MRSIYGNSWLIPMWHEILSCTEYAACVEEIEIIKYIFLNYFIFKGRVMMNGLVSFFKTNLPSIFTAPSTGTSKPTYRRFLRHLPPALQNQLTVDFTTPSTGTMYIKDRHYIGDHCCTCIFSNVMNSIMYNVQDYSVLYNNAVRLVMCESWYFTHL